MAWRRGSFFFSAGEGRIHDPRSLQDVCKAAKLSLDDCLCDCYHYCAMTAIKAVGGEIKIFGLLVKS